jgi:hypothetical protein
MNRPLILVNVESLLSVPITLALSFGLAITTAAQNPLTSLEKRGKAVLTVR